MNFLVTVILQIKATSAAQIFHFFKKEFPDQRGLVLFSAFWCVSTIINHLTLTTNDVDAPSLPTEETDICSLFASLSASPGSDAYADTKKSQEINLGLVIAAT